MNVIGLLAVPEFVGFVDVPAYVPARTSTVSPAAAFAAPALIVQNGCADEPDPESEHDTVLSTVYVDAANAGTTITTLASDYCHGTGNAGTPAGCPARAVRVASPRCRPTCLKACCSIMAAPTPHQPHRLHVRSIRSIARRIPRRAILFPAELAQGSR